MDLPLGTWNPGPKLNALDKPKLMQAKKTDLNGVVNIMLVDFLLREIKVGVSSSFWWWWCFSERLERVCSYTVRCPA